MKQVFLVIAEIEVTEEYLERMGGAEDTAVAIAGAMSGLLNPRIQNPDDEWNVVDVTAYPMAR